MFIAFYHHLSVLLVLPPSFCFLLQPQIPSVSASIDCVPAGCSNVLCMNRAKYNPPICANDPDPSADCFSRATCAPSGDFRECAWVLTEDLTSCLRATGGYEDGTACDNNGGLNSAVAVDGCVITGCSSEICRKESVVSPCIFRESFLCYNLAGAVCGPLVPGDPNTCGWKPSKCLDQCIARADSSSP